MRGGRGSIEIRRNIFFVYDFCAFINGFGCFVTIERDLYFRNKIISLHLQQCIASCVGYQSNRWKVLYGECETFYANFVAGSAGLDGALGGAGGTESARGDGARAH